MASKRPAGKRSYKRRFQSPLELPRLCTALRLPGYAPDLNPWDEGGWNHLKHVELRNLACCDLEELHEQFHLAVARLRRKPHLVQAFFAQAGLTIWKS